jgi:hypothetical protein
MIKKNVESLDKHRKMTTLEEVAAITDRAINKFWGAMDGLVIRWNY